MQHYSYVIVMQCSIMMMQCTWYNAVAVIYDGAMYMYMVWYVMQCSIIATLRESLVWVH